ncbi:hypothetical protein ACFXJ5_37715 [Streptomyces sp. NPDC059373]
MRWSAAAAAVVAGLLIGGAITGVLLPTGTSAATVALVWAAFSLRALRLAPACPSPGGGGAGPGGAGVREPRRPKPCPPGGAIALQLPEGPPDGAAALA